MLKTLSINIGVIHQMKNRIIKLYVKLVAMEDKERNIGGMNDYPN